MPRKTPTMKAINEQLEAHGIEFGESYRDPASGFEGVVKALYFYEHGCLRVSLRGMNKTTGEPAEFSFDAPELEKVATGETVPPGTRTGGPHDLRPPARR